MTLLTLIAALLLLQACVSAPRIRQERDPSASATERCDALKNAVAPWLGTPYRYGGTDRRGLDCSAFTRIVIQSVYGKTLPRTTALQVARGKRVRRSALQCGDLVFFKNMRGRGVDHVGIYMGNGRFVHASVTRGVVYSDLNQPYYRERYAGARRYLK